MKSNKVVSNLLQQNCYVRDVVKASDLKTSDIRSSFDSIVEKVQSDGVKFERVNLAYPITPQYVNSFVDSSDYRKDVNQAITNGVPRSNLGDIRRTQELAGLDFVKLKASISELLSKFSTANPTANSTSSASVPASDNSK